MKDKDSQFAQENGSVSFMNNTRWRSLAEILSSQKEFEPMVRLKYLRDTEPMPGFSFLDWEWIKHGNPACIEWMDIDPIKRERQGKLIPDKETDLRKYIKASLNKAKIKYSIEDRKFRVWGYAKIQPDFV